MTKKNEDQTIEVEPIGWVKNSRDHLEDDDWGEEESVIELNEAFLGPEALKGLDAFSHLEVVFFFDRVGPETVETGERHPRGRTDWPSVGILAQRAKRRPNRIGLSRCKIISVDGPRVHIKGLDAVEGTPVLEIKPYMEEFGPRGEVTQPAWSKELMEGYY